MKLIICPVCFKVFKSGGFPRHLWFCKKRKKYYENPKKCGNIKCNNIISFEKRFVKTYCCRKCAFTKERRIKIGNRTKKLLAENPELFGTFGTINRVNIKYKKDNIIVHLQSSYELKVAKELDKYNIKWTRPTYLKYIDKFNKNRKYFPDFYLVNYDIYLDPKNNYLITKDTDKINRASKQNNVKILILRENELEWNKILVLINNSNRL